jgi:hypothetical protein
VSRDGRLLALRTYTDAYVWPLTGSDVPAALAAKPTRLALPAAPQGEAITFSADNRHLVVGGEGSPSDVTVVPLAAATVAPATASTAPSPLTDPVAALRTGRSPVTSAIIAAVIAAGLVWVGGKLRRRRN